MKLLPSSDTIQTGQTDPATQVTSVDLVNLPPLPKLTSGRPEMVVGLIDGPVVMDHPDLKREQIREIPGRLSGTCAQAGSLACMHGTFVAGILCAKRGSAAPAICPNCALLVRPIFAETAAANGEMPGGVDADLRPTDLFRHFPRATGRTLVNHRFPCLMTPRLNPPPIQFPTPKGSPRGWAGPMISISTGNRSC